uniref:Uncharacterized protein n=1 Tax=Panagrolaimus sp. PS1159 TaxID=55785 RepID=A0AC35FJK5_9BILA
MALPFKKRLGNLRLSDYDESVLASEYTSLNSQSFDGSISTSAESSSASDASSQDSGIHDDLFVFPEAPENSLHLTNRLFRREKKLHVVLRNRTPHHICLVNQERQIRSHAGEFTSVMHLIQFHFTTSAPICSKSSAVLLRIPVPRPKFIQKVTY